MSFSPYANRCLRSALILLALAALLVSACAEQAGVKPLFVARETIPSDAIVLFDGKDLSQWAHYDNVGPATWKVEKGYAEVRGGDIRTKKEFTDYQLHVEFWLPLMPGNPGENRANSGVFMNGAYEIQILDSYGVKPEAHQCGAMYSVAAPLVTASRPAKTWQTYDIFFHGPRIDAQGKKTANARISVLHNGVWIHENAEFPYPTAHHEAPDMASGPIILQDHGHTLRFRNIWIRPLPAAGE